MYNEFKENDYAWIKELMGYPQTLDENLGFFEDTSQISVPDDPIERVIFQERAKEAIRKIAQNKGHILMVGKPRTGKSMLSNMFENVLDKSLGDYMKPKDAIIAYPGKDRNHIRVAYEHAESTDNLLMNINKMIELAKNSVEKFSLSDQIRHVNRAKKTSALGHWYQCGCRLFLPACIYCHRARRHRLHFYVHAGKQS